MERITDINILIGELMAYGMENGLVAPADEVFVTENPRVREEVAALRAGDFQAFLRAVKASGDSSFKYLQNVYTNHDVQHQNVSVALAVSEAVLGGNGVSRVHGGGFAGTIQAFVKNEAVAEYKKVMDQTFGKGACSVLQIRKYGGMKVL